MKVIVLSWGIPTKRYPNNGVFQFEQALQLSNKGLDILFLYFDFRSIRKSRKFGTVYNKVNKNLITLGLNIPLSPLPTKISFLIKKYLINRFSLKNKDLLGEYDIFHSHFIEMTELVYQTNLVNKYINFVTEHSEALNKLRIDKNILNRLKPLYEKADKLYAVSRSFQNNLVKNFGIDFDYLPNIYYEKVFKYIHREMKTDKFIFATTSNLVPSKRIEIQIQALKLIKKSNFRIELWIFGEGSEKSSLKAIIKNLNLENQIHFFGFKSHLELIEYYKFVNVFLLTSKSETFNLASLEALATGMPIISTRCGGPEMFISSINGLYCGDSGSDLAKKMQQIMNEYSHYDQKLIAKKIKKDYSSEITLNKMINDYREIFTHKSSKF